MTNLKFGFADILQQARHDAGKSQDFMAKSLCVSKKTIQNWESGDACPTFIKTMEWFSVLKLSPMSYYMNLVYGKPQTTKDVGIEDDLIKCIKDMAPDFQEKLLYILSGNHGSSQAGLIELTFAHLHTSMYQRIIAAQTVYNSYKLNVALKNSPDLHLDVLERCIYNATQAVINNIEHYNCD